MEWSRFSNPRPGKFEGESRYVPYFWERRRRRGEKLSRGVVEFRVSDADLAAFPELRRKSRVRLYEAKNGLVVEVP